MELISLTKQEVPQYAIESDYFSSLSDEGEFTIPRKFLKPDSSVSSSEELHHILETCRFWGLHKVPTDVFRFLFAEEKSLEEIIQIRGVLSEFDAEIPFLQVFQFFQMPDKLKERSDVTALIKFAALGEGTITSTMVKTAAENGLDGLLNHVAVDIRRIGNSVFSRVSMQTVVSRGNVGSLRFLLKCNCRKEYGICDFAASCGRLECLKLMHEYGYALEQKVISAAAFHGHLSCLEYAHNAGCKITEQVAIDAAAGGNMECVNYVFTHGAPTTNEVLISAAKYGHANLLPLLQERGCTITSEAVTAAASKGHMNCLQYLIDQGANLPSQATNCAASGGHIACLKLLRAHSCSWDVGCVTAAASAGHSSCVDYLLQAGCPINSTALTAATTKGHANCLALLLQKQNQVHIPQECVDIAAKKSLMECLKLLHDAQVPLDLQALHLGFGGPNHQDYLGRLIDVGYHFSSITAKAAIGMQNVDCLRFMCEAQKVNLTRDLCVLAVQFPNNLRFLKLLHEHKCPWGCEACASAAEYSNLDGLSFLHEQGCPWDSTTFAGIFRSKGAPPIGCLLYALENGCPIDGIIMLRRIVDFMDLYFLPLTESITTAAVKLPGASHDIRTRCNPDLISQRRAMLEYLHNRGCPWDERTCIAAAEHPTADCLQFLHQRGCPWSSRTTLAAASHGSVQCLQYALQQGCPYDEAVVLAAAAQPTSACLQLLHSAGCRLSVAVAYAAADAGSLACLQYASEQGCPWDATVSEAATQHAKCLHFCVQQGCPIIHSTMEDYNRKFNVL